MHLISSRLLRAVLAILSVIPVLASDVGAQGRYGAMTLTRQVDPMTEENTSYIRTVARSSANFVGERFELYVRCDGEDDFDVIAAFHEYLGDGSVWGRLRFDDDPVTDRFTWSSSTQGTSAFMRDNMKAYFVDQARQARRVRIQLWDFRGTSYMGVFSLMGFTRGIAALGCVDVPEIPDERVTVEPVSSGAELPDSLAVWPFDQPPTPTNLPRVQDRFRERFPVGSLHIGEPGLVTMLLFVGEDGKVKRHLMQERIGQESAVLGVVTLARALQFKPATKAGESVEAWVRVTFLFQ